MKCGKEMFTCSQFLGFVSTLYYSKIQEHTTLQITKSDPQTSYSHCQITLFGLLHLQPTYVQSQSNHLAAANQIESNESFFSALNHIESNRYYRATGTSYGPVSVSVTPSVCHKSVFSRPILHSVIRTYRAGIYKNKGTSLWKFARN